MPTPYYMQYPPLPNATTQEFIDASGITATGSMFDDFRSALVAVLELSDSNALTMDDLWQLYVINKVSADANAESGNPAGAGRGKSGFVGGNPGHYYAESHRRNAAGGGFPVAAAASGLTSLGTFVIDTGMVASTARGVVVSPDGTKIIWDDTGTNTFKGGTMSTAHDPASGTQDTSRAEYQANNFGITCSPDGLNFVNMPVNGVDFGAMSTAWDVDTLAARSTVVPGTDGGNIHIGVAFNDDGTKVFLGTTTETTGIKQFTCVTAYDVDSVVDFGPADAVLDITTYLPADQTNVTGHIDFNSDGTLLFFAATNMVLAIPLATGFDLSTASAPTSVLPVGDAVTGIHWDRTNDDALWVMSGTYVARYSTFADPSPAAGTTEGKPLNQMLLDETHTGFFNASGQNGPTFSADGTVMVIHNTHNTWAQIEKYDLSVAWDVSTAVYDATGDIAENVFFPTGLAFGDDGNRLFTSDSNEIGYYDLSTPYDTGTAGAYVTHAVATGVNGFCWSADGTKLYIFDTSENIDEHVCSTAWLPSSKGTASVTNIDALIQITSDQDPNPSWPMFDSTGTRLYVVSQGRYINELYLSTAWDSSTVVATGRKQWQNGTISGLHVRQDTGNEIFTSNGADDIQRFKYAG